jgi:hypothetical protein
MSVQIRYSRNRKRYTTFRPQHPEALEDPMIAALSLSDIKANLAFLNRYPKAPAASSRLVGLLFGPPSQPIMKDEILPGLDDLHHCSGENVDVFHAGYYSYGDDQDEGRKDRPVIGRTTNADGVTYKKWFYDPVGFVQFVKEVQDAVKPRWRYSQEVDLLLFNVRKTAAQEVLLDFSSLVVLKLAAMKRDKAIGSASELYGTIFNYVPHQNPSDPASGFSNAMAPGMLLDWLMSLLPAKLNSLWKQGRHYAVLPG